MDQADSNHTADNPGEGEESVSRRPETNEPAGPEKTELEIQNEELRQSQVELEDSRNQYIDLYDFAPIGYLTLHEDGRILQANLKAADILKTERPKLHQRPFAGFILEEDRGIFHAHRRRLFESGQMCECTLRLQPGEGPPIHALMQSILVGGATGQYRFRTTLMDITAYVRAEDALRESETRFRALVTATSEFLYWASPDWVRLRVIDSRGFLADTPEPIETWLEAYVPPEDHPNVIAAFQEAIRTKSVYEMEHRVRGRDGSTGWVFSRAIPLLDPNGTIREWFGVANNITERKRAEEALRDSEARYRGVVENTTAIILRISPDGVINYANERALQFFGYCADELIGKPAVGTIVPERDSTGRDLADMFGRLALDPEAFHTNANENMCRDGRRVWVEWTNSGFYGPDGRMTEILSVGIDATDRKRAEEALVKANEELEQRVAERTRELSESVQALNQRTGQLQMLASELTMAEQRERRRLAQVLHDGLQQVLVASRMRLEQMPLIHDAEARQRCTDQVFDLLSDSIEISRSLTAELSPPILHEGGFIPALEWLARWMHDKQGLDIDLQTEIDAEDLPQELTILLFQSTRELLFNVVKHAGVKKAFVRARVEDGQIVVTVSDQGRGFDPQAIQSKAGKEGGYGLFSIRERLDLLGGRLAIDSEPGRGSTLCLYAPMTITTEKIAVTEELLTSVAFATEPREAEAEGGRRIRIMLVDDHPVLRQGLRMLFRDQPDLDVIGEASDGEAAIRLAREIRPDVILMDVSMPRMNGIEATRAIHRDMPETRIIGLSMFDEADRAETMREAGAVTYLSKTAPSEVLIGAVRQSMSA
ncbi:MAG: PAS domain S-box protein [Candidatus Sumerlaeia bacterium]